jgi:hypothetical protein
MTFEIGGDEREAFGRFASRPLVKAFLISRILMPSLGFAGSGTDTGLDGDPARSGQASFIEIRRV